MNTFSPQGIPQISNKKTAFPWKDVWGNAVSPQTNPCGNLANPCGIIEGSLWNICSDFRKSRKNPESEDYENICLLTLSIFLNFLGSSEIATNVPQGSRKNPTRIRKIIIPTRICLLGNRVSPQNLAVTLAVESVFLVGFLAA